MAKQFGVYDTSELRTAPEPVAPVPPSQPFTRAKVGAYSKAVDAYQDNVAAYLQRVNPGMHRLRSDEDAFKMFLEGPGKQYCADRGIATLEDFLDSDGSIPDEEDEDERNAAWLTNALKRVAATEEELRSSYR
jgi:hypothetical protein